MKRILFLLPLVPFAAAAQAQVPPSFEAQVAQVRPGADDEHDA